MINGCMDRKRGWDERSVNELIEKEEEERIDVGVGIIDDGWMQREKEEGIDESIDGWVDEERGKVWKKNEEREERMYG